MARRKRKTKCIRKVLVLKLYQPSITKSKILYYTLSEYLQILNTISPRVNDANSRYEFNNLVYHDIKTISTLSSDIIEEAIKDVWKSKTEKHEKCSIRLNKRWFKFVETKKGNPAIRITYSPRKRVVIPIKQTNQYKRFTTFLENGWICNNISILSPKKIAVVLEKPITEITKQSRYVIGIYVGSEYLAAVSILDILTGKIVKQLYFGKDIAINQRKISKRRGKLQSLADTGSKRAKNSLSRIKRYQSNYVKTRSGQIAKQIANLAIKYNNASIAIENLKGLRRKSTKKTQKNKSARKKTNKIPYGKFKQFLESNCKLYGIKLHVVDPYNTSKWCTNCGAVNEGHYKKNRSLYVCNSCNLIVNSDRKASVAIAIKSLLERNNSTNHILDFVQFSKRQVPVNGLLRPREVKPETIVPLVMV